jgi:hypothetical protein
MIFGTFCIAMTLHILFMFPETAKKSLEEIDIMFIANVCPWRSAKEGNVFEQRVACVRQNANSVSHNDVGTAV